MCVCAGKKNLFEMDMLCGGGAGVREGGGGSVKVLKE